MPRISAMFIGVFSFLFLVSAGYSQQTSPTKPPRYLHHGRLANPNHWARLKAGGAIRKLATSSPSSKMSFDSNGRLVRVLEPDVRSVPSVETDISYDASGNVSRITQHGISDDVPRVRTFSYDALGHVSSSTSPEAGTVTYTHDSSGNIESKTDARGITISYGWDAKKRLIRKQYSDGKPAAVFVYGGTDGSVHSYLETPGGHQYERVYHYDTHGGLDQLTENLASNDQANSYSVGLQYDGAGRISQIVYPDGRVVSQDWTTKGLLRSVTSGQASYFSGASYWPSGYLRTALLGSDIAIERTYNAQRRLSEFTVQGKDKPILHTSYRYTATGSIAGITDHLKEDHGFTYSYDTLGRVSKAVEADQSFTRNYVYDAFGNRGLEGGTSAFDANNRFEGSSKVSYDEAGEVTFDGEHSYDYSAEGLITDVDHGAFQYVYDAEGNRVQKIIKGKVYDYVWCDGQLLAEKQPDGTWIDYIYANGARIASVTSSKKMVNGKPAAPQTKYFVADPLGTERAALSGDGVILTKGIFAPFGEAVSDPSGAGSTASAISFTGEFHDDETGLDNYRYRSYNSKLGRWMSPDPSNLRYASLNNPQTFNLYSFVVNDPLKYVDSLGLELCDCDEGDGWDEDGGGLGDSGGGGGSGGVGDSGGSDPGTGGDPGTGNPCPVDACVVADPEPPIDPIDPTWSDPLNFIVTDPDPSTQQQTIQREQAAETQAKANVARYLNNSSQLRPGDSTANLRFTVSCDSGNHDCTYTLTGMGTNVNPITGATQDNAYYVWEHQTQPVLSSVSVGTMDNITPPPSGAPEQNQFSDTLSGGLDSYRFFTISTNPVYNSSSQVPIMINEQGVTAGYEHIYSTGGSVYINGSSSNLH